MSRALWNLRAAGSQSKPELRRWSAAAVCRGWNLSSECPRSQKPIPIAEPRMEIRNTATQSDLEWLDTPELISQLLIGLRNVAVHEQYLPRPSDTMVKWIGFVQHIYGLLVERGADWADEVDRLSQDTGWLMLPLLEECLQWPTASPHVKEKDGIRRFQRCWLCHQREYPDTATEQLCDECLLRSIGLLRQQTPPPGVIFFRTYNESRWCSHAHSETVLMTRDEYDFLADGRCAQCLKEEYDRRHSPPTHGRDFSQPQV
jgi:hypothetical protein